MTIFNESVSLQAEVRPFYPFGVHRQYTITRNSSVVVDFSGAITQSTNATFAAIIDVNAVVRSTLETGKVFFESLNLTLNSVYDPSYNAIFISEIGSGKVVTKISLSENIITVYPKE